MVIIGTNGRVHEDYVWCPCWFYNGQFDSQLAYHRLLAQLLAARAPLLCSIGSCLSSYGKSAWSSLLCTVIMLIVAVPREMCLYAGLVNFILNSHVWDRSVTTTAVITKPSATTKSLEPEDTEIG